jgi:hypothetical protein
VETYRLQKMKSKHWILILLVPLSEMKALFYSSNEKVSWYVFTDHKKLMCNVLQDYSNVVIFGVIFYYLAFIKVDLYTRSIAIYLFILNALDLLHLGLMDMQYFIPLKLLLAYIILYLCNRSKIL